MGNSSTKPSRSPTPSSDDARSRRTHIQSICSDASNASDFSHHTVDIPTSRADQLQNLLSESMSYFGSIQLADGQTIKDAISSDLRLSSEDQQKAFQRLPVATTIDDASLTLTVSELHYKVLTHSLLHDFLKVEEVETETTDELNTAATTDTTIKITPTQLLLVLNALNTIMLTSQIKSKTISMIQIAIDTNNLTISKNKHDQYKALIQLKINVIANNGMSVSIDCEPYYRDKGLPFPLTLSLDNSEISNTAEHMSDNDNPAPLKKMEEHLNSLKNRIYLDIKQGNITNTGYKLRLITKVNKLKSTTPRRPKTKSTQTLDANKLEPRLISDTFTLPVLEKLFIQNSENTSEISLFAVMQQQLQQLAKANPGNDTLQALTQAKQITPRYENAEQVSVTHQGQITQALAFAVDDMGKTILNLHILRGLFEVVKEAQTAMPGGAAVAATDSSTDSITIIPKKIFKLLNIFIAGQATASTFDQGQGCIRIDIDNANFRMITDETMQNISIDCKYTYSHPRLMQLDDEVVNGTLTACQKFTITPTTTIPQIESYHQANMQKAKNALETALVKQTSSTRKPSTPPGSPHSQFRLQARTPPSSPRTPGTKRRPVDPKRGNNVGCTCSIQ